MERVLAQSLSKHVGKTVTLRGWLNNIRALGKLNFLILRDRSGFAQVIVEDKEELRKVSQLQPGSVLRITGTVVQSDQLELGAELINPKIIVEIPIQEVPSIEYYKPEIPSDLEHILDHRPIQPPITGCVQNPGRDRACL